jgi:spermidine synthase
MNTAREPRTGRLALALMVASGFAGLGYQIVWTQQAALWLGHEAAAVLAVVAAFFAGIAVGALALGPAIRRSAAPKRWYAACEAVIGLWALMLALLLAPVASAMLALIGAEPSPLTHWAVAFGGTFVLLLPATAPMGATLPAVARALAELHEAGAPVAALYAANTFGAVLGVLATAFWLVPSIGLTATAAICASLSLAAAAAAPRALPDVARAAPRGPEPRVSSALPLLAATGFLGIGYEIVVVRILSTVTENTVYTFAILLAIYLVGTALGAAAYARLAARAGASTIRDRLLRALAASCLLGALALAAAAQIESALLALLGTSMSVALGVEAGLAAAAFLLPTIVMGALFSHLATAASASSAGLARALGVNTLGAAAAPLVFGVVLVPELGSKLALLSIAAGYLVLSTRRAWLARPHWAALAAVAAVVVWAPTPARVAVPDGGRLVGAAEGVMGTVAIVEDAGGTLSLHVDNGPPEGSSATLLADARQALLPMLLHAAPRRALFLGLGTGITAGTAADDATSEVTAVELLPEIIDAAEVFAQRVRGEPRHPRLRVLAADARRFVRATEQRFDVVVADNFHPARSGSGALYTVEHFEAVRARLAYGGLFCQWLPLHQLDLETLRSIVRSFLAAYPRGAAVLATYSLDTPVLGLVGHADGGAAFDRESIRRRLATVQLPRSPAELGLDDELALFGTFVAGPHALAAFAGSAPLNTDDRPVVAYRAPRLAYEGGSLPRDRLIVLLRELDVSPGDVIAQTGGADWYARLEAYWTARDAFIAAGRNVEPTLDARRMLAQVRGPLLDVLHKSPDFRPAYDPLLEMALDVARDDSPAARSLLLELQHVRERPEVARALRDLDDSP